MVLLADSWRGSRETREDLLEYARTNASEWFRWADKPPEWIQDAEWPFADDGKPMVFLGQIDVPAASRIFHDEGRVFVFIDSNGGEVKTVTQIAEDAGGG